MNLRALVQYSFWWSEVRLVVASIALFLGGIPPVYLFVPISLYPIVAIGLKIAWIVSGCAALYLLYRWYDTGQRLFGGKDHKDTLAFMVLVLSGVNIGFAGIFGINLGMQVTTNHFVFFIVGALYLVSAWQLWKNYKKHKQRLF